MNFNDYSKLLDQKISDAWYNWEYHEKKAREVKAAYEAVVREKQSFEEGIKDLLGEGKI